MFLAASIAWDPIGKDDDLGPGPCKTSDLASSKNGGDKVAVVRQTWCSGMRDDEVSFFVFIHDEGESNSRSNLAFRYTPTLSNIPPAVAWTGARALKISVHPDAIVQVTEERDSIDGVDVTYSLGPAAHPPALGWWQRPFGRALQ
jgi:hypothetical protein